jgi:glutamyl-tRNA synthetase
LLYNAFGWEAPQFAHLPLIMKPAGKGKLSKRDGDKLGFPVFPLDWKDPKTGDFSKGYKEAGFFPEAVINFLAFLGWNPGTEKEIFSLEELINAFELERVHKAGARFDPDKTKWYNHHYMQLQNNNDLAQRFKSLREDLTDIDINYIEKVVGLIKERATFISEFWGLSHFFFIAPTYYDEKASKKAFKEETPDLMTGLIDIINSIEDFTLDNLQTKIKDWITQKDIGFGKVMMPLRLALVGSLKGPEVFDIMSMIGKTETIKRIENMLNQ